jgi:glycosyltransferase involved in cell wall biosynthesis
VLVTARPGLPGLVSVIVPSRSERFLVPTVTDLLAKAQGPIEILVVLDGYWEHALPSDSRVKILHFGEAKGMRPAINAAAAIARGEYLMKCDGHTLWADGWDVALKADYHERNWIVIPRRYALDPEKWEIDTSNKKYPVDYHFLSSPFHVASNAVPGLHGSPWTARREARKDILLDDELASQGSAWFTCREHWQRIGPLDASLYGVFWFENQEMSLKTWLSGGAQKVNKKTFYAHLYKGTRYGRGYNTRGMGHEAGTAFTTWFWMTDQPFPGKTRTMRSLIEQFSPVQTWGDLDETFARAAQEFRNPYQVAA